MTMYHRDMTRKPADDTATPPAKGLSLVQPATDPTPKSAIPQGSPARKSRFTYVPLKNAAGPGHLPLDEIPADVKDEVEAAYETLRAQPNGRLHIEFGTKAEANQYVEWVTSYCKLRPAGEIRYRKSPVKNQPDNHIDFRITDIEKEAAA